VTISGGVTIFTECFTLNAGATITGVGMGYGPDGTCPLGSYNHGGPGAGPSQGNGICGALCGGGGHGGAGAPLAFNVGTGPCSVTGGPANDDPVHPQYMGSAGGYPNDAGTCATPPMDFGGGLLEVVVYNPGSNTLQPATLNGTIDMSGSNLVGTDISNAPGGAGAGGTILIEASTIGGTGTLAANAIVSLGIIEYCTSCGGGGGGIISLIENDSTFPGTLSVTGANPGIVTFTAAPTSGY
jgi:hypothetical protein